MALDREEVQIAQPVDPSRFPFSRIEIYTHQQLGRGSYGFVCKARCDKLLCAAKLLHNVFFSNQADPGTIRVIRKFNEECRILGAVVHPCIVQFLGVAVLGKQPVLLTELMDESLMTFIARSSDFKTNISLHYEVDIAHDVAMGLSYLHSRSILHRDLSSNNVLLSKGRKAKITDFGVSKFFDSDGSLCSLNTSQTGCPGTIQFMPPEAIRNRAVYSDKLDIFSFGVICVHLLSKCVPSPGPEEKQEIDPQGRKIYIPIPEMERRMSDINKISPSHALLPITISMIADEPSDRPTADHVCDRILDIKETRPYLDSANEPSSEESLLRELQQCQSEKKRLEAELAQLKSQNKTSSSLEASCEVVEELKKENAKLKEDLEKLYLVQQDPSLKKRQDSTSSTSSSAQNSLRTGIEDSFNSSISSGQVWSELGVPSPCCFSRGSAASVNDKVYFSRPFSTVVHELDVNRKTWSTLEPCITEEFSLTVFDGHLVAVGGIYGGTRGNCSNSVRKYNSSLKIWQNDAYPALSNPRALPACASNEEHMVVAGGSSGRPPASPIGSVEIYCKQKDQWYNAYSLPIPLSSPVAVIRDDDFFVIGGTGDEGPSWQMFHCSLSYLFKWSNRYMIPVAMRQPWQQVQLPVASPAAVVVSKKLYLFGGTMGSDDGYHEYSNHMLKYKEQGKKFRISVMPCCRGACLAAVLSSNSVVVVGGCGNSNAIDIANIS